MTSFFVLQLLGASLLGCTPTDPVAQKPSDSEGFETGLPSPHQYNVIMLVADTLRARSTSLVEGERDTTPQLAAWADQGVVFDNAIAPSGWTPPSIASVFSGLYMSAHGLINYVPTARLVNDVLPQAIPTLPEMLQDQGYRTEALSLSAVMPSDRGWGQGFDVWEYEGEVGSMTSTAGHLTNLALDWLKSPGEDPFFLYVHYMDPHAPYRAPEPWYDQFVPAGNLSTHDGDVSAVRELYDGAAATTEDAEKLAALYDGEAAYWDSEAMRIPQYLAESGLDEDTIVVVLGDHGEQFGEHGSWLHYHLWQENIHVPLVISVPGAEPRHVAVPMSLVDLAPTLASLLGLPPWEAWQGEDLSEVFQGDSSPAPRALFSEFNDRWVVLSADGWKAYSDGYEETFLHNLVEDPLEAHNLQDDMPEKMAELTGLRFDFLSDSYGIQALVAD